MIRDAAPECTPVHRAADCSPRAATSSPRRGHAPSGGFAGRAVMYTNQSAFSGLTYVAIAGFPVPPSITDPHGTDGWTVSLRQW